MHPRKLTLHVGACGRVIHHEALRLSNTGFLGGNLHGLIHDRSSLRLLERTAQHLISTFPIHHFIIHPGKGAGFDEGLPCLRVNGLHIRLGRQNRRPIHHARRTMLIQEGYQGFPCLQGTDGFFRIKGGVGAESLSGYLHRLLIQRRISTQGMLDTVA